jgi:phage RecT family recombinase
MDKGITRNAVQKAIPLIQQFGVDPAIIQKEITFALNIVNSNNKLKQCSQDTILASIIQAANLGLTLNPESGECALIPRGNQCSLMPMYQGIANIAYRNGNIVQLITKPVHEKDNFEIREHDNENPITHTRGFGDRGDIIGFYTIIVFKDGRKQAESMDIVEVHKVREMSDGYQYANRNGKDNHPWIKWFSEMGRKACLKRALKYVNTNSSTELARVIELDNSDYKATDGQIQMIERLLPTATISHLEKGQIEDSLLMYGRTEAGDIIEKLEANQLPNHPGWNDRVNMTTVGKQVAEQVQNQNS